MKNKTLLQKKMLEVYYVYQKYNIDSMLRKR